MDMPIMVGTECNKPGQRLVDDFKADALQPYISDFIDGANVIVGQTRLLRFANLSYVDSKTNDMFKSKAEKNQFYAKVGALPAPDHETMINLFESEAEHNLDYIQDCVKYSKWI